jgi:hypothetical protein
MEVKPITIRDRLQDYEFTDDQELTLTLELLNRIEKDIDELRSRKTRDGFSEYVALAGLAAALFVLLAELKSVTEISFSPIAVIFVGGLLLLKIPWALYQLVAIDQATKTRHEPGRFFWSNDLYFENRIAGLFQLLVFLACLVLLFLVSMPAWIAISTATAFLLYIFLLGLVFVLSFKKEPFSPNNSHRLTMVGIPTLFLAVTIVSLVGLISRLRLPVGNETSPYVIAGLLLTLIGFVDRLIRLSTPSLQLEKLEKLRYDIIFLKADLSDAWTRYEVIAHGHDISEELRSDLNNINNLFNVLDYGQSQKEKCLLAIHEELKLLEVRQQTCTLNENDFNSISAHRLEFFRHAAAMKRLSDQLQPQLDKTANDIHRISRSTQQWERAHDYHQQMLARLAAIEEKDKQIARDGGETDVRIDQMFPKQAKQNLDDNDKGAQTGLHDYKD